MTTTRELRLVVLDWDGTVMDSSATIVGCMRQSMLDAGVDEPPDDDTLRSGIGLGLGTMIARLLPDGSAELHEKVRARYRHHWLTGFRADPRPYAGAHEAIEEMHRREIWLAVATGKSRAGLDRELDAPVSASFSSAPGRSTRRLRSPIPKCSSICSTSSGSPPSTP